ncbi:hypothetical protein [Paraburkholderia sp. J12]|uniref:hypothetical protein n=1 Tax=Paraburkholderia sp. J12 TaxID=2805432 RepID=UPI002ABE4865|nr:hypothetical protein [Paraburkholderia sp. J12]
MKTKLIFAAISVAPLLLACANKGDNKFFARTSRDYLVDIKRVSDSDDLSDFQRIGKILRIDFSIENERTISTTPAAGPKIDGWSVTIKPTQLPRENINQSFSYGLFRPTGRDFSRVQISFLINTDVICITPVDLMDVFGHSVNKYLNPHTTTSGYIYKKPNNSEITTTFKFLKNGCLTGIGFSQNSNRN